MISRFFMFFSIAMLTLSLGSACAPEAPSQPAQPALNTATATTVLTATSIVLSVTSTPEPTITRLLPTPTPVYFSGAGDIAICGQAGDNRTAALLLKKINKGLYFTAGDNSNEDGTLDQYQNCFGEYWGLLMKDLRVVPGNHDYYSDPMENYFVYFDDVGEPGKGWYSFDHGSWHIVMLNSNCGSVECGPSSEQIAWLRKDLAKSDSQCTMAIWHHPLFSSGKHGNADWMKTFWDVLYEHGADVVVNGHNHFYERMAKVNPDGELDENGIRGFVVGTGGAGFYGIKDKLSFSEVQITHNFGVIHFELYPDHYTWQFINIDNQVMDKGEDVCSPLLR